jgi:hypothetical protein
MPDFMAAGGDGLLPIVTKLPADRIMTDRTRTIRDLILDTLKTRRMPLVPKKDGRITVLNAPARNEVPTS